MENLIGRLGHAGQNQIRGWAVDLGSPGSVEVYIYLNGKFLKKVIADQKRQYQVNNQRATGPVGFSLNLKKLSPEKFRLLNQVTVKINNEVEANNCPLYFIHRDHNLSKTDKKIYFLHIPKTAGTSLNDLIAGLFPQELVTTHIESNNELFQNRSLLKVMMFLSGHIPFRNIKKRINLEEYFKLTVLRDPFQQLISHLNCVQSLSENTSSKFFKNHAPEIKELSLDLRKRNLEDPGNLRKLIETLGPTGTKLFDNCQTRHLMEEFTENRLTEAHLETGLENLQLFDQVGTLENITPFLGSLRSSLGIDEDLSLPQLNVNPSSKKIAAHQEEIRNILNPLIRFDQYLYDSISS